MIKNRIFITTFAAVLLTALLLGQIFATPQTAVVHAQAATAIDFPNMTLLSPNGQKVVSITAADWNMAGSAIHLANANGTQDTILVAGDGAGITYWVTNPVWSSDSQEIAYMKVVLVDLTTFANYRYELWAIEINGSNNRLLNNTLFHPAIGYGGKTDFIWNATNEIEFPDGATYPPKKYAVNVDTLAIREITMAGSMAELPSAASVEAVPAYWQADPRWGSDRLGGGEGACTPFYTLASSGSAVTASAMSISSLSDSHLDPGEENARLGSSAFIGDCLLVWQTLATYYHSIEDTSLLHPQQSDPTYMNQWRNNVFNTMRSKVDEGIPVMLWYYTSGTNMNFLVVTAYDGTTITANDPSTGNTITRDFYATTNYIRGMVFLTQEPPSFPKTGPEDDAEDVDPRDVTLSWDAISPTPESYRYCLRTPEQGLCDDPNSQSWTGVGLDTQVSRDDLQGDTTYTWQVQANYGTGQVKLGANLNVGWTFKTGPAPMTTISGTISGNNVGLGDVTITYTNQGNTNTTITDSNGDYSFSVPTGASGVITPSKTCYNFSPASITYNTTSESNNRNFTSNIKSFSITGNLSNSSTEIFHGAILNYTIDGVTSQSTAGNYGNYAIQNVQCGKNVTVTPSLSGVTFVPSFVLHQNIQQNVLQNYVAKVAIGGNVGPTGANITVNYTNSSLTGNQVSPLGGLGNYGFTVLFGSSGTITPTSGCYTFTPASVTYTATPHLGFNFTPTVKTYSIGGNVGLGVFAGTSNVTVNYTVNSVAKTVMAGGGAGNYQIPDLPCGSTVIVTPSLSGITFSPLSKTYTNLLANQNSQNYTPQVLISGNAGHMGSTVLTYIVNGVEKTSTAGVLGNYSFAVPYNWTGTVTPSRTGVEFDPPSVTYTSLTANQLQNYDGVFTSLAADDGFLVESGPGTNVGAAAYNVGNTFRVGDDASNRSLRSMLSFDTSALPDTAVIQSAVLKIKFSSASTNLNFFTTFGDLRIDIKQGTFGAQALEIGDLQAPATVGRIGIFSPNPDISNWYSAIFNPTAINANINKLGITQFRLRFVTSTNNNAVADYMMFSAGDHPVGFHPQLIITYTVP